MAKASKEKKKFLRLLIGEKKHKEISEEANKRDISIAAYVKMKLYEDKKQNA